MSYNLLGLDFGFNAYPKGANNDEKVIEISPLKFLSVKNHADDFVVNTETGGKYWWLYRTARSNYAWNSNREISLKTHICPGFWYTIFVHLLFWVISPLAFVSLMGMITQKSFHAIPWWTIGMFGIPGFITPLWLLVAMVKRIVNNPILKGLKSFMNSFHQRHENFFKWVGIISGFSMILLAFGFVTLFIYNSLAPGFGIVWSILIILTAYLYLGYKIYSKLEYGRSYKITEYPLYFRIPIMGMVGALVVKFIFTYPREIITFIMYVARKITSILHAIVDFFVMMGPLAIVAVFPLVIVVVAWYLITLEEKKQEKAFDYITTMLKYFTYGIYVVIGGMFLYMMLGIEKVSELYLIFFWGLALFLTIERFIVWSMDPRVKKVTEEIEIADRCSNYDTAEIDRRILLKNLWFQSLDKEARIKVLERVIMLVGNLFVDRMRSSAFDVLLLNMTLKILDTLTEHKWAIASLDYKLTFKVFKKISLGQMFDDALSVAKQELEKEDAEWQTIKKIMKIVFFPAILLWELAKLVFTGILKLLEYAKTLYRLYELFNERCPFITKKRVLRMD